MIPTMLLMGLVIGRLWLIPLGGLVWAVLVVLAVSTGSADLPLAAALGAANAAVGVLIRWAAVGFARLLVRVTRLVRAA